MLDARGPVDRWFPDATLNTCYNALDRHVVAGHADRTALIHDSPVTGAPRSSSYADLLEQVAALAGALRSFGVVPGDRVLVVMPMVPEAVVAMLACARLGAVHAVVPVGSSAEEALAGQVDGIRPRAVVSASCSLGAGGAVAHKPVLDRALGLASHQPEICVVKQRPQVSATLEEPRDVAWDVAMRLGRSAPAECVEVAAADPLYLLDGPGAGDPPGVTVRDNGAHAVAMAWALPHAYGVHPGQVWWAACDLAGPVGHSRGRLRAPARRGDDGSSRGGPGRPSRCRCALAGRRRPRGRGAAPRHRHAPDGAAVGSRG